jgi:hypothetical protein
MSSDGDVAGCDLGLGCMWNPKPQIWICSYPGVSGEKI